MCLCSVLHGASFCIHLHTAYCTKYGTDEAQKLKCLMVDPPFRTPWVICICMVFFFHPLDLTVGTIRMALCLQVSEGVSTDCHIHPRPGLLLKKKITNGFLFKGETHRKVFALSCCCIVSGHFVALFALKNQHQNLSLTITQSRSLDHGHLHCSMAPLRHWAYLFIDTHMHAHAHKHKITQS